MIFVCFHRADVDIVMDRIKTGSVSAIKYFFIFFSLSGKVMAEKSERFVYDLCWVILRVSQRIYLVGFAINNF